MAYRSLLAEGGINIVLFDIKDGDAINFTLYDAEKVPIPLDSVTTLGSPRRSPPSEKQPMGPLTTLLQAIPLHLLIDESVLRIYE